MAVTMREERNSPMAADTVAITSSWMTRGLFSRSRMSAPKLSFLNLESSLGPYSESLLSASLKLKPLRVAESLVRASSGGQAQRATSFFSSSLPAWASFAIPVLRERKIAGNFMAMIHLGGGGGGGVVAAPQAGRGNAPARLSLSSA